MSDPVTNVEIEDVLSSIRRLVTEENRPDHRKPVREMPETPDRLVLTPALRVADAPDVTEDEPDTSKVDAFVFQHRVRVVQPKSDWLDAAAAPSTETQDDLGDDIAIEQTSGDDPELADDVSDAPDAVADHEDSPWNKPGATLFEAAQHLDDTQSEDDTPLQPIKDMADPEPEEAVSLHAYRVQPDQQTDTPGRDEICSEADGTAAGSDRSEIEPESETEDNRAESAANPEPDLPADPDREPEPEIEDAEGNWPDEPPVPGEVSSGDAPDPDQRAATLSAKIEALEAVIGDTADQWEPDGVGGDDYAGTPVQTLKWQDHDDADQEQADGAGPFATTPASAATGDASELEVLASDEAILDEESLRELVTDIVREELQGALGERITRNVRKLVRREIHRALTAQELD